MHSHHQDRDATPEFTGFELPEHFKAVHSWHLDIEGNQIDVFVREYVEGFSGAGGFDDLHGLTEIRLD